jgi:hypothetical protein
MADNNQYSDRASSGEPPEKDEIQAHYESMIARYDAEYEAWHDRSDKIMDIYTEKRKVNSKRRMSLLWANTCVLQPAVYARMPLPTVLRRFKDRDPVARVASEMVERCLAFTFDMGGMDPLLRQVRDDYLLVGRGTAWARYDVETEPQTGPDGEPIILEGEQPAEKIKDERVCYEYVHWKDFGHNVARHWGEVTDVWRKVYLNRAELKRRFKELDPDEIASIPLDFKPAKKEAATEANKQAIVYEIWCKASKKCYWIVKGFNKPLDVSEPPINLHGFFPCPKPTYSTTESASLIPVPDYVFYQDQAEEVDELTAKIATLSDSLKLVGFYPADTDGDVQVAIEKAASPTFQNKLVPVKNWATFTQGGSGSSIDWWPALEVSRVISECIQVRKALIDDVYQLTGISDIVRGQGQASETATQSNIKNQWGSMRIRDKQTELARFARDLARIGGEIISEHFSPETMMAMSNTKLPTEQELMMEQARMQEMARMQAMAQAAQQLPPGAAPAMAPRG